MENQPDNATLITTFCEITSAAPAEAQFYLESHNFDLSSALSTFLESADPEAAQLGAPNPNPNPTVAAEPEPEEPEEAYSPSHSSSPSRSRSPSPRRQPYNLRSASSSNPAPAAAAAAGGNSRRGVSGVRTLSDLNRQGNSDSDDEPQGYYTGGEKSGMMVQDPSKRGNDVESIYNQARQAGAVELHPDQVAQPSTRSGRFTGTARLLSGETVSHASPQQPPAPVHNSIFLWRNGFSVDDGPLRRFDDPENAPFLESIKNSECPDELQPANRSTPVHCHLVRKDTDYVESQRPRSVRSFQGVGRTVGGESGVTPVVPAAVASPPITTTAPPPPTTGLIVDQALPSTSIQLRLADGTRMVSRFNFHHTLRDIRGFIDASRPGGSRGYLLQTVGFPPKQLTDLDQTVEQAGLANSVVIQKL